MTQVLQLWQLRRPLWRIFVAWWNLYKYVFNTAKYTRCYSHSQIEHPNQVKGFVKTVIPSYCDPKCNVQHCASPFLQLQVGPQVRQKICAVLSEAYIQKHKLLADDSLWRHYRRGSDCAVSTQSQHCENAVSIFPWESSTLVCLSFRGRRGSCLFPAIQDPLLLRHGGEWACVAHRWIWLMS